LFNGGSIALGLLFNNGSIVFALALLVINDNFLFFLFARVFVRAAFRFGGFIVGRFFLGRFISLGGDGSSTLLLFDGLDFGFRFIRRLGVAFFLRFIAGLFGRRFFLLGGRLALGGGLGNLGFAFRRAV
jgi:hypothetical protein